METFSKKNISVRITLAKGSFDGYANEIVINSNIAKDGNGMGVEVNLQKYQENGMGFNKCDVKIYNLPTEIMDKITTLYFDKYRAVNEKNGINEIEISVGNVGETLTPIFFGQIFEAHADYSGMPDTVMSIYAITGQVYSIVADNKVSYQKGTSLDSIFKELAEKMNCAYINEGVTGTTALENDVSGSAYQKLCRIANTYGVYFVIDDRTLYVFPADRQLESTQNAPVINKDNGLIGYPSFSNVGIHFKCLYDPRIRFQSPIKIESIVPRATGVWKVIRMRTKLSAFVNRPVWECEIDAFPYNN